MDLVPTQWEASMHVLTWKTKETTQTWHIPEGLFDLGGRVEAPGMAAVVVSAGSATLLLDDRSKPLPANRPVSFWEGSVTLRPAADCPLTTLECEPTFGDTDSPPVQDLVLTGDTIAPTAIGESISLVGRHPACHIRIDDPRASAAHCLLQRVTHGVRVFDLGSTNGTFVNNTRAKSIVVVQRTALKVGSTTFVLRPVSTTGRIELVSSQMKEVDDLIARVAPADVPVLIQGESGVGKDDIARRLHHQSGRVGRLVPLNAAAITPTLAASELFGHARGAFTGAECDRDGAFQAAHQGTLFLDEIAELPLSTQAELLRVVEEKRVRRVGEHQEQPVDVRLIAATHRNLTSLVASGGFRADLFHRICVVPLTLAPLRERPDDLEVLARHFLASQPRPRRLSRRAWVKLRRHPWPGNIRELLNVLRRACLMSDQRVLDAAALPLPTSRQTGSLDGIIHDTVVRVHAQNGGSVAKTARQLGIHRATVYRHINGTAGKSQRIAG